MQIYGKTLKQDRFFPIFCNFAPKLTRMKYFEVDFQIKAPTEMMQDSRDLLASIVGDIGFETFEETEDGLRGYIQVDFFDEVALERSLVDFPIESATILYNVREAEYKDWNEEWEREGFEPIVIDGRCAIHDGRHTAGVSNIPTTIEIDAKLAFGTGSHETTRMMVSSLLDTDITGKRVLDCGTGTGILAITALKLGAREAFGYDIDEWSTDNALHNAVINHVDDRFTPLLGNSSVLDSIDGSFDVIMANINRNILLNDMPKLAERLSSDGVMLLSGFYDDDVALLSAKASAIGLSIESKKCDASWACISLKHII